ncbi:hypothetical protein EIP91_003489 [Steccherinum ochraceum]|uniref:DUF4050 domain-containing protein n=1 Tax=Steccherinum ochraceum TaxID=92696 RepID=A0A4R0S093_9APHY|nr:hypothetical protein EIP91_003489 [Steccherinum ochraceum]
MDPDHTLTVSLPPTLSSLYDHRPRPPHSTYPADASNIVVTAPSSPESSPGRPRNDRSLSLLSSLGAPHPRSSHDHSFLPMNRLEVPDHLRTKSHFELLLEAADLPEPGPAHFAARQKLWRVPRIHASTAKPQHPVFEKFLKRRGGRVDSDETWRAGLDKVWKGIMSGAKLKQNMPLNYLIQILQAGWMQDGTWPRGSTVQPSDDELEAQADDNNFASPATPSLTPSIQTPTSGTTGTEEGKM